MLNNHGVYIRNESCVLNSSFEAEHHTGKSVEIILPITDPTGQSDTATQQTGDASCDPFLTLLLFHFCPLFSDVKVILWGGHSSRQSYFVAGWL